LITIVAVSQEQDVEGSKDHPLIKRYSGSFIERYLAKQFDEYELPLGPLRDGAFVKTQRLEGKYTRIVYHNPPGRSSLEVFRNYQMALQQAGFQLLFACKQLECGASKEDPHLGWFGNYSGEEYCRYLAAKLTRADAEVYVALNVYDSPTEVYRTTTLVVMEMKPMETGLVTVNAEALAGDLSRTGHVAVYGIYFDTGKADLKPESDPTLAEIAKLLKQTPALKLHVVGHTDSQGDLAMNMDLSKRRAAAVVAALTAKHGIAAARLRPEGVGPLAPVASNKTEDGRAKNRRVELVEQ
jgi:outer membrane protein OmpA-like peptidoglycan-associated protein